MSAICLWLKGRQIADASWKQKTLTLEISGREIERAIVKMTMNRMWWYDSHHMTTHEDSQRKKGWELKSVTKTLFQQNFVHNICLRGVSSNQMH